MPGFIDIVLAGVLLLLTGFKFNAGTPLSRAKLEESLLNPTVYDKSQAPAIEHGLPTNVTVQLFLHNVYSVNEIDMEFSVDVLLRQSWLDHRLDFRNKSSLSKLELGQHSINKLWLPDTIFANEKYGSLHLVTQPNQLAHVFRDGTVFYSLRLSLALSCPLDIHFYPFDEQLCPVKVQSYGFSKDVIDYYWHKDNPVVVRNVLLPKYEIVGGTDISRIILNFDESGSFVILVKDLHLKRKVGYHVLQVFLPSVLIVCLSWVSFWLDHGSSAARTSIGMITVLTMITFVSALNVTLPAVSYVKAIDVWCLLCLVFVWAALLEFAFVSVVSRTTRMRTTVMLNETLAECVNGHRSSGVNDDTRIDVNSISGSTSNTKSTNRLRLALTQCFPSRNNRQSTPEVEKVKVATDVHIADKVSRALFPISFAIFLVIFFVFCGTASSV